MIVSTPDGQVQFPDDMSQDDIKGVLQKKYGAPQTAAPAQVELQPRSLSQVGSDVANFGRVAANALGIGDSLLASQRAVGADIGSGLNYLTGKNLFTGARNPGQGNANDIISNLAAEKIKTEQASQAIGPAATFAANLVGSAPVGGMTGKTLGAALTPYTGKWLASVLGSTGESAAVTGGAAAGRSDPIGPATLLGALFGLPGGVPGRGTRPSTADLLKAKEDAFAPLKTTPVNAPAVDAAFNGVSTRSGAQVNLSPAFKDKVAEIEKEVTGTTSGLTAEDIADYQRALWNKTRNGFDERAAGKYGAALDGVVGPSTAYDIKAANKAHNVYKTSDEIDNWLTDPASAPSAVAARLAKKPAFYKSQPGLFELMQSIGQKANDPPLWMKARNYALDAAARSALGAGASYLLGEGPYKGAALGFASKVALPHAADRISAAPISRSLRAAQHLNATGVPLSPGVYAPQWLQTIGPLARQSGYAAAASGAL